MIETKPLGNKQAKTILIIEDEELIALDTQNKLIKKGFEVYIANTHDQAVAISATTKIDAAVVDISLSDKKDGIDAVIEIKKHRDIPVVYATAYDDEALIKRLEKTNPHGYILKPYDEAELLVAVNIAIERSKKENAISEKNRWITSILNTITDIILVTDTHGYINFANHIAKDVLHITEESFPHLTDVVTFYDEDSHKFNVKDSIMNRIVRTGMPLIFTDMQVKLCGNMDTFNANCRFAPLKGSTNSEGVVIAINMAKMEEVKGLERQGSFQNHS